MIIYDILIGEVKLQDSPLHPRTQRILAGMLDYFYQNWGAVGGAAKQR